MKSTSYLDDSADDTNHPNKGWEKDVWFDGQSYVPVRTEPYNRKDGTPSVVQIWRTRCFDCSELFEFKRSLKAPLDSGWRRRCDKHKAPGRCTTATARQRQIQNRKRIKH